jgi:sigma-E factor negative regulatory protein RseB
MFAQIEVVDHIPDEMLRPAVASDKYTWHNEKQQMKSNLPDKTDWAVRELPTGFKLSTYSLQQMPNSNVPADHMVVSDGLATISVYVEQFSAESQPFVGASHLGAINIYGAVVGDYQVTVVGEVPDSTVRMVAESVHLQKPGDVAID